MRGRGFGCETGMPSASEPLNLEGGAPEREVQYAPTFAWPAYSSACLYCAKPVSKKSRYRTLFEKFGEL